MLNAGQSVFLLIVITRVAGINAAGVFSTAFATGNLFLYLGNYGVRNYQVSDLEEEFSFADYLRHRLLTVALMLVTAAIYTAWSAHAGDYSAYKTACVYAMCLLKAVDCLEEVFEGRYQQKGRLDRSGQLVVVRLVVSIGGMMVILAVTGDLLISTAAAVVLAAGASVFMIWCFRETAGFDAKRNRIVTADPSNQRKMLKLMKECLPVCAANFFSFYLINEPKYAIDAILDEASQAYYNFIAMPVFVIQLLNMFLYQPQLISMTKSWEGGDKKTFMGSFYKLTGALVLIAVPVLAAAWLLGTPVLSMLYGTDLGGYRMELMLILVGGIFLAFNGFYCAVLTITRAQNQIPFMFLAGCALSVLLTPRMVRQQGITGAVIAFVIVMATETGLLTGLFLRTLRKKAW